MMYDFTYRSPSAPTLGALLTPLEIEGAPDHGTIADAQVWADHYEVRIDLLDGTGRVCRVVGPDGQVRDLKTVWFDAISPSGVEMATARALRESVERMGRVAERMRDYFVVRGADRAMSGKTAILDDLAGLRRLQADMRVFRTGRSDEFERLRDVGLRRIDFWQEPPVSLSYDMVAAFRGQTCPDQFEMKQTTPARARHLSSVSVDLLIAVGQIGGA